MITKNANHTAQVEIVSMEDLVPDDHILRKIDRYVDFSFIYDLVEDKYSFDTGRPSIDPVMLIKIPMIQCMFGIKSMRQTIKEIEVNVAYRWFLGLGFHDAVPHFSTFGKNYTRRFAGTDLFEQIFSQILMQCMSRGLVETETLFVDSTHVKAAANKKKAKKVLVAKKTARYYEKELQEEIRKDREAHGKKPLKDNKPGSGGLGTGRPEATELKEKKVSTVDEESGWFHKGDHEEVFAYSVETACDIHGWITDYSIHPGNEHDSVTFPEIYEKVKKRNPKNLVMDAGYKVPPIAKRLIEDGIRPILPYKRPMTKKGYLRKREYVYDEYYDCYLCPANEILKYSTTNRDGYREYKSNPAICAICPYLEKCTQSINHIKVVTRHVWAEYMEICEDIRHTPEAKELYGKRKETIERNFGTAKEHHGMRYTQLVGKAKMSMKVGLTYTCMNMKKLARILDRYDKKPGVDSSICCY